MPYNRAQFLIESGVSLLQALCQRRHREAAGSVSAKMPRLASARSSR
jgi:hypothetical protein